MRLINTDTMKMELVFPPNIPRYIILSHRWGDDEVSYQDFVGGTAKDKPSYRKIEQMVALSRSKHFNYVWIDTCCINKTDGPELSESINSMYQWYRNAAMCIAYLADVPSGSDPRMIVGSEWFDRGWTLQELVAPRIVYFYDTSWTEIGDKTELIGVISAKTNVPKHILANMAEPANYSLARRMSWAANRVTTRIEDVAYCLLGIFQVNMPLLYGEGTNSFRRLQEEIIKYSNDLSIFAWRVPEEYLQYAQRQLTGAADIKPVPPFVASEKKPSVFDGTAAVPSGAASPAWSDEQQSNSRSSSADDRMSMTARTDSSMSVGAPSSKYSAQQWVTRCSRARNVELCLFASSPKQFSEMASLQPFSDDFENFSVTNRGLLVAGSVYLRLMSRPAAANSSMPSTSHYLLLLGSQRSTFVGIYLTKTGPNLFQRNWDLDMAVLDLADLQKTPGYLVGDWYILIDRRPTDTKMAETFRSGSVHVPSTGLCNKYILIKDTAPTHLWDVQDRLFVRPKAYTWTRYEMVLAIKCSVVLRDVNVTVPRGHGSRNGSGSGSGSHNGSHNGSNNNSQLLSSKCVNFVVLCRYQRYEDEPRFIMFLEADFPKETEMLMARRAPNNSLIWADFDVLCPKLASQPDNILVNVGTSMKSCLYRISLQCTKSVVNLEYSQPSLHSLLFDIRLAIE